MSDGFHSGSCLIVYRDQIMTRVKSFPEAGIQLRIFVLPTNTPAPSTTFWKEVNDSAKIDEDADDFGDDVLQRLENLFDVVRKKSQQKRSLASLPLTIIKDITCAVKVVDEILCLDLMDCCSFTLWYGRPQKER